MLSGSTDLYKPWTADLRKDLQKILAEHPTVQIFVRPGVRGDIQEEAQKAFSKLGLSEQEGVLVFLAWKQRKMALVFGSGVQIPQGIEQQMAGLFKSEKIIPAFKLLVENLS